MKLKLSLLICLISLGACDSSETGTFDSNETRVYVPVNAERGPFGLYAEVDYHEYPKPIEIDFSSLKEGNDLVSVISNYYYSISTKSKPDFVELFSDKDGGKELARKNIDKLLEFKIPNNFNRVELRGYIKSGSLIAPLLRVEPEWFGTGLISCMEDECHKASYRASTQSFNRIYTAINGRYADHWRKLDKSELEEFSQAKNNLQRFTIAPPMVEHQIPAEASRYPTVYLNFRRYDNPRRIPLLRNQEGTKRQIKPEVEPIVAWLELTAGLERKQARDKDALIDLYKKTFDYDDVKTANFSLFQRSEGRYSSLHRAINQYALSSVFWKSITPVGYIQNGDVRYVYFYPWDASGSGSGADGMGIIQFLPVRKIDQGYKLDIESMPFTPLGPITFPEGISLASEFLRLKK